MKNFSIIFVKKVKAGKNLTDSFRHNERIINNVRNADPIESQQDIKLIDSNGLDYNHHYHQAIDDMKKIGVKQSIRKDAVAGLEIFLGFSREMEGKIDIDQWAEKSFAFLDEKFNPPNHEVRYVDEHGLEHIGHVQNIKHCVVHRDESNTHIHAFIVPITESGRLNAHNYVGSRYALTELQSEYAKAMKDFGLKRGVEHSTATYQQVSQYYTNLVNTVEATLPEPERGEDMSDYLTRANRTYQVALSHTNDLEVKNKQAMEEIAGQQRQLDDQQRQIAALRECLELVLGEEAENIREYSNKLRKAMEEREDSRIADALKEVREYLADSSLSKEDVDVINDAPGER